MSNVLKPIQVIIGILLMLALGLSLVLPNPVFAQQGDGIERQYDSGTGKVNFISTTSGRPLAVSRVLDNLPALAIDPALAIAQRFGPEFGLNDAAHELKTIRLDNAGERETVHYQQMYQGIPVMAGELIVNTNDRGDFISMNGETALNLSLPTQPTIDSVQASQIALQAAAKWYRATPQEFKTSTPDLWIFDESLFKASQRPAELVWRMDVIPVNPFTPVRELVLVNAQRGSISLHFNQFDVGAREIGQFQMESPRDAGNMTKLNDQAIASEPAISPSGGYRQTYTANHGTNLPGQLLCNQTISVCTNGSNLDADLAHKYAAETWSFYYNHHGRDSIDNQGMTIISTVQYSADFINAYWDGTQMVYGDGMVADDIVGHELTHGVTQYESNLFYYYQSGAINESFSDVWGELIDQSNTSGNDTAAVKWQIGEDSPVGAFRSMSDPTLFGDPDSITSPNYDTDPLFLDNGGVHHNSGINNKAAYLMVAGGTFGGKTVTALGANKTLAIYYEAQTNLLTSGADYADLYAALYQACLNLIGGPQGITNTNCQEARDATDAVGMNLQPSSDPNFNTDTPLCDSNETPQNVFYDDMESGTKNWMFGSISGTTRWRWDSPNSPYAHSGQHSLYANDLPATVTDTYARLKSAVSIPSGAFLSFSQAFGFEDYFFLGDFDGGVLEYSTNGGASWSDISPLFINNGYNGTIDPGYDNPLAGRSAFVADSHGYITSRVNLSPLANQNVIFRWRMGLDTGGNDFGWWLDDVNIYTCGGSSSPSVVSIHRADPNPIATASVHFLVTFSESVSGVNASDFALTTTGVSSATVSGVSGSGNIYTVTVNTGSGSGTIRLDVVDNDSIKDTDNNPLGGTGVGNGNFTNGEVYTIAASIQVKIGGVEVSGNPYTVAPGEEKRLNYPISDGPVVVHSTNAVNLASAIRLQSFANNTLYSFVETMGVPSGLLSYKYYFPTYNNTWGPLNSQLRFANINNTDITVKVTIGNTTWNYAVLANSERREYLPVSGGPVIIESDDPNKPIIAAIRLQSYGNNTLYSFAETLGIPAEQLSYQYYFPTYNNTWGPLNSQLRFANINDTDIIVKVTIGTSSWNYDVPAHSERREYLAVSDGPVIIESTDNTKPIIAAIRLQSYAGGRLYSFVETMGVPSGLLSYKYYFPTYNNTWGPLNSQLRFANINDTDLTVKVTIGTQVWMYPVPAHSERREFLPVSGGPAIIESTDNTKPIIAAIRLQSYANNTLYSFSETLGIPVEWVSDTYYFPTYNNTWTPLNSQLRFGVP